MQFRVVDDDDDDDDDDDEGYGDVDGCNLVDLIPRCAWFMQVNECFPRCVEWK